MQNIQKPLWEIYENQNIDLIFGGTPIPAQLSYSSNFGIGQIAGIYVSREVPLSQQFIDITEEMLQDNFMKMQIADEHVEYFDIPHEHWDFTNIESYLNQAHGKCSAKQL